MIPEANLQKIESIINDVAASVGVKVYDVEFASGGQQGRVLRIYIDKEGGVGIDDCANVSRGLNEILDTEDPIPGGEYTLEVSSPGLDRVLKKTWHYEAVIGKKIWIKTDRAFYKTAKQITEILQAVENDSLKFHIEGEDLLVPIAAVEKAKMVFEMEQKGNKNPHQKKGSKR